MKNLLIDLLVRTLQAIQQQGLIPPEALIDPIVTPCKNQKHGDFATNCALSLAKAAKMPPKTLASKIVAAIPANDFIQKVEIANPGFINFFLNENELFQIISTILQEKTRFGYSSIGEQKKVHIEYVSANPTGPLHVGHGRGAAYGACVANLLTTAGFKVHREYYVNDIGRQMKILALSVWLRYLELQKEPIVFPKAAYLGHYIIEIAEKLIQDYGNRFHYTQQQLESQLKTQPSNKDEYLDNLTLIAEQLLGQEDYAILFNNALQYILKDIHDDLQAFGVSYDTWFHESALLDKNLIQTSIELLESHQYVYQQEGAKWFRATLFGDKEDRVLVRKNGVTTYFASDVAYHLHKYHQGYDRIINVFGADHHGYVARIEAFLKGLNKDPKKVRTLLVQFAVLYRGETKISMSTRAGEFVTLRELREEIGNDAARFFYIMLKPEQHLDFDLELAKSQSKENPVYYIQYAHARVCSVWRRVSKNTITFDQSLGEKHLSLLTTQHEKALLKCLLRYQDTVKKAALNYQPHLVAHFLLELANHFHSYYNAEKFLVEHAALRNARLCLIKAVQYVLVNGLLLLGISAPQTM